MRPGDEYVRLLTAKDSEGVQERDGRILTPPCPAPHPLPPPPKTPYAPREDYLANGVAKLHRAGVDFLVIASNTAHICVGPSSYFGLFRSHFTCESGFGHLLSWEPLQGWRVLCSVANGSSARMAPSSLV